MQAHTRMLVMMLESIGEMLQIQFFHDQWHLALKVYACLTSTCMEDAFSASKDPFYSLAEPKFTCS